MRAEQSIGPIIPPPVESKSAEQEQSAAVPRLALRPKEAAAALSIGERLLWSLTNRGAIPHIKLGKCVLYPVAELERWLSEQAAGGSRKRRT
ncbi:MAG TPA: helix-turn-helix domain-containing protein [Phycisphaerae bacterium]|nr:helix-turn-helix domain-containing protein [Phycisphaerae bacterium]